MNQRVTGIGSLCHRGLVGYACPFNSLASRKKMSVIIRMIFFSKSFLCVKIISLGILRRCVPVDRTDDKQALVGVMVCCRQTPSHHQNPTMTKIYDIIMTSLFHNELKRIMHCGNLRLSCRAMVWGPNKDVGGPCQGKVQPLLEKVGHFANARHLRTRTARFGVVGSGQWTRPADSISFDWSMREN